MAVATAVEVITPGHRGSRGGRPGGVGGVAGGDGITGGGGDGVGGGGGGGGNGGCGEYSAMVDVAVEEAVQEAWVETAEVVAVKEVKAETAVRCRRKVIPRTPHKVCHICRRHPRTDVLSTF